MAGLHLCSWCLFTGSKHQYCIQIAYPRENWYQRGTYISKRFLFSFQIHLYFFCPFHFPVIRIVMTWWLCQSRWCLCSLKPGLSSLLNQFYIWFTSEAQKCWVWGKLPSAIGRKHPCQPRLGCSPLLTHPTAHETLLLLKLWWGRRQAGQDLGIKFFFFFFWSIMR